MIPSINTYQDGEYHRIHTVSVRAEGRWQTCRSVFAKADGQWHCVWSAKVVYLQPLRQYLGVQDVCASAA